MNQLVTTEVLAERFNEEKLANHWCVNESPQSFELLINHLNNKTNFLPFFKIAWNQLKSHPSYNSIERVCDLGCGIGWTTSLIAKETQIKKIYAVEPSNNRRNIIPNVASHFEVDKSKIELIEGGFNHFNLPDQYLDLVVMSSSFHHCFDKDITSLFANIKKALDPKGPKILLISNEHYVRSLWTLKKIVAYYTKHLFNKKDVFWGPGNWRAPYPFDGEHWRTESEIRKIFAENSRKFSIFQNEGNLCIKDPSFLEKISWTYYYSILEF